MISVEILPVSVVSLRVISRAVIFCGPNCQLVYSLARGRVTAHAAYWFVSTPSTTGAAAVVAGVGSGLPGRLPLILSATSTLVSNSVE